MLKRMAPLEFALAVYQMLSSGYLQARCFKRRFIHTLIPMIAATIVMASSWEAEWRGNPVDCSDRWTARHCPDPRGASGCRNCNRASSWEADRRGVYANAYALGGCNRIWQTALARLF